VAEGLVSNVGIEIGGQLHANPAGHYLYRIPSTECKQANSSINERCVLTKGSVK
jgi:hypothetical protein